MCYHRISLREAIVILAVCLYLLVISAGNARAYVNVDVLPLWQQGLARPSVYVIAILSDHCQTDSIQSKTKHK